jgi:serine/threonine-protein kinase HipA
MTQENKCLFCYENLRDSENEFHPKCSEKIFGSRKITFLDLSLNEIEKLASESINRSLAVPGVQKKISLELKKNKKNQRLTIVGYKSNYILKPPSNEYRELPGNEDLTMHLAQIAGIETSIHSLIRFKSGELACITKRFDRENDYKISVEDMNQLSGNLTYDKYNGSVERVSKIINEHCTYNALEVIKFFKLLVFCFITGNADMHLKNFSIMTEPDGHIKLSPAYDLLSTKLVIPEDKDDSALTINGKKRNIRIKDLKISANTMNIEEKAQYKIFSDIKNSISMMTKFINKSFLSDEMKAEYIKLIEERIKILKLF